MTTGELAAALLGLESLPPAQRYKAAKEMITSAERTLSTVCDGAAAEGLAAAREHGYGGVAAAALEFGVTRDALYKAAARHEAA